jgi:serine/threonine protein kinase/Flp pilus assembly protein TadD/TolA-binding protein/phage FluMu protein Com
VVIFDQAKDQGHKSVKCPKCQTDNPTDSKFCKECATPLPVSREFFAHQTETLQTPIKELTTGSTFAGRYQIIEELGKGGMGKVYRVLDKKLKEEVALKLIKAEISSDKEMIERFSNELKLARKIAHRNVGKMYELMEAEGTHFITMEYVPGQDLRGLIRQSKQLAVGTAVGIAKQICEGLAEAHALGVVHRDLKPSNIMIDKGGSARIMDFGIARSLSGKGITGAGVMIGTPEYMSPEQVEGKEADQRSDIYSLGVILYQMVTGRVPFEGDTPLSVAVKQKTEAPRSPRTINPQVPEDLSRAILRCLDKEKEKRYQTAEEVLADLDRIEKGIPTAERIIPKKERLTSREITVKFTPKKFFVPGLVFLALIAVGIIIWRILPSKRSAPPPSASGQPTLAVLYFENKSGDPKLDNWRDGLTELLIEALSQSRYIRVVSSDQLYTILKRLGLADARKYSSEDIEKIAAQTRATHVLRGSFIKAGDSFVITAGLQKPGTAESPTALRLEARDEKDIIAKVDELTRQVKEGLNFTPAQIAGDIEKEAGKVTTSSPEALKYYIVGRRLHLKLEWEQSIACMEKAVAIDPEFAMAYRSMGVAHDYLGHIVEMRKNYKKALDLSDRLPENERLPIEAIWLAKGEQNYAKAIEVLERLVKIYPGHILGQSWLAWSYYWAGNLDKAIEYQEFIVQNEKTADAVNDLAIFYIAKGLYQKAEDVCRPFLQDVEDNGTVRHDLFYSYLYRRKFDLALAEAEKLYLLGPSWKSDKGIVLFCKDDFAGAEKILLDDYWQQALLLARGKINEMIGFSQRNLETSKGDKEKESDTYGGLASALETAGRYEDAYQAFGQYLSLSAGYRKSAGESGPPYLPSQQKSDLFSKGKLQAEMKSFDEARKTAEELKSLIEKGINTKELRWSEYILGQIEFGKGNYRKAAELFGNACGRLDFEADWASDHALFFDRLARALYESGDLEKARQNYEKITLLTIGRLWRGDIYAKAYYMLGKIAEQQGDKARAIANYRKFLDLWKDADAGLPEVADARKRLAGLKGR